MLKSILIILGVLFLASILGYLIPQIIICILPERNLKKRYGDKSWAFITGGSSGIGKSFALKVAKQVFSIHFIIIIVLYLKIDFLRD
jgi:hypothetical protein